MNKLLKQIQLITCITYVLVNNMISPTSAIHLPCSIMINKIIDDQNLPRTLVKIKSNDLPLRTKAVSHESQATKPDQLSTNSNTSPPKYDLKRKTSHNYIKQ